MKVFVATLIGVIVAFVLVLQWGARHQPKYVCPAGSAYSGRLGLCLAGASVPLQK